MTTSAPPWTISASAERIEIGPTGEADTTFTVTNNGPVDQRLVLDVVRSDNAGQVVVTVAEPQRLVPHGGSVTFLVKVKVPPGTPPGSAWVAGRAYSADGAPEETAVLSDRVAFEIKPSEGPRKRNIWIWLIPVIVLVVAVIAVVLFFLLRDDDPPPGPPVHKAGELVVTDDGPFDLDELQPAETGEFSGLSPDADVQLFGAAIEPERFFQATDNATMARIGPNADPKPACEAALVQDPIFGLNIADFDTGDIFCVRTSENRLSVAEVRAKVSDLQSSVTLQVTTFES